MLLPHTVRPMVASLLTAFALFGCQDDSSSSTTQDSSLLTYTAIDGYLMQAKVYFDENVNGIAEEAEYQGLTNERGVFIGAVTDAPVIIKIVAGLTTDSDYSGSLTESRELVAAPGITEISPFSTLAFLQGVSLSDIAHELGIDVDKVSGDFIAKGHEDAHLLARSLFQQFDSELSQTQSNITAIHNRAQVISQFIQSSVQSDFQGRIVYLDENQNPVLGDLNDPEQGGVETRFSYESAEVQWEQTDYSEHQVEGGTFHPCYPHVLSEDRIVVGNCFGNYFLLLSAQSGEIINKLDLTDKDVEQWSVNGSALIVEFSDNEVHQYDDSLNKVTESTLTYPVVLTGDGVNLINHTGNNQIDTLSTFRETRTERETWGAEGVAYRVYTDIGDTANLYEVSFRGELTTKTDLPTSEEIKSAVIRSHNTSPLGDTFEANENNTIVSYLAKGQFLVRVDSDQRYVSEDYHYVYNEGELTYLGLFPQGNWYMGLDNSTVSWYSSLRSAKVDGVYPEPHYFQQFSLDQGKWVGDWTRTHSEFSPVLYRQVHSQIGIVSVSDSYSSVSLIR